MDEDRRPPDQSWLSFLVFINTTPVQVLYVISRIIKCHKTLKALANRETLLLQRRFYSLSWSGHSSPDVTWTIYILTRDGQQTIVSLLKREEMDSGTGTLDRDR